MYAIRDSLTEEQALAHERGAEYLFVWLIAVAFTLGLYALWSGDLYLIPVVLLLGYFVIFCAFGKAFSVWKDIFNPLYLVLTIGLVRYSAPACLLMMGIDPPFEAMQFYVQMHLADRDWQWAHVLALTGVLGVILGWSLVHGQRLPGRRLNFHYPPGVQYAALVGMLIGFAGLLLFIIKNGSLSAIFTGALRGTEIQVGTGKYFRLSLMLISSGILLSGSLLARGHRQTWLIPVIIAAALLWVLGGRGRAITPLAGGLLLRWYASREQKAWVGQPLKPLYIIAAPLAAVILVWILYLGGLYRGGSGIQGFGESLSLNGLWQYFQYAIFTELGHLHSLAGAVAIGPGVLEGRTFIGSLSWPLPKFLPIPGRSAGVFIIDTLIGSTEERKWGLHASLIGDAYLNFGLAGIGIVMVLYGMMLKLLYVKFCVGILHSGLYVLTAMYAVHLFLKSIEAWPHMLTIIIFAVFILFAAKYFRFRSN
jgi:hypothetical protein